MELTDEERLFFAKRPQAESLYQILREKLSGLPGVKIAVFKTQISFSTRRGFCVVSHPPLKRLGESALMVSFSLPWKPDSLRLFRWVQISARRFTCHMAVAEESQLDDELMGWVLEAHGYASRP